MINRERELEWLTSHLNRNDRQFLVVYGRRRVGKTTLVTTALDSLEHEAHYYLCDQRGPEHNATQFARQCAEQFDDVAPDVDTYLDAFRYLKARVDGPFVVAIDEFSYLVEADETIPSVFQTVVDDVLADTEISIVLLGSSISMMEEGVLSYESPLYGRRTGQWRLEPLTIGDVAKFFPQYDADTTIQTYSVLGGVPAYLEQFDGTQDLVSNIEQHILSKGEFLYEEPEFLLRQELREPTTYMAILEAIANGATRVTEIANRIDKNASGISRYLKNLTQLALVERETPVTDPDGRGVYKLTDHFVRFWFRYVSPNRGTLEQGRTNPVRESIAETLPTHTSYSFEEVCRHAARTPSFPVSSSRVGRWWDNEQEIDVVGVNPQTATLFLGECKWTTRPVGWSLLNDLESTEPDVRWQGSDRDVVYGLFSRSGFTDDLVESAAQRENVHLFTPSDVLALFETTS